MQQFTGGLLLLDTKLLLGKRALHRRTYPNVWDAIGGHCEPGETPAEVLRRELREELGIEILEFELLKHFMEPDQFSYHLYVVRRWDGTVWNKCLDEHSALEWFTPAEAMALPLADTRYLPVLAALQARLVKFEMKRANQGPNCLASATC